jgi:Tfp pilus assembly protein PilW
MSRGDEGLSIVEVVVAMTIGLVVLGLAMMAIVTFLRTGYDGVASGQANDNAALAFTVLRREVVNADIVYTPATTGFSVLLLTAIPHTTTACVQWRVKTGSLEHLTWPNGQSKPTGPWVPVATGITNQRPSTPPFVLDTSAASYGHRVLKVVFDLSQRSKGSGTTLALKSSITALDGQFYAPTAPQFC